MGLFSRQKPVDYSKLAAANRYAADLQYKAAQEAIAMYQDQFDRTVELQRPWREAGEDALATIRQGIADGAFDPGEWEPPGGGWKEGETWKEPGADELQKDPGYMFRLQEGMKAVRRGAAARGLTGSGATLKALQSYGQSMASQEYAASRNRALEAYQIRRGQRLQDYQIQRGDSLQQYQINANRLADRFNRLGGVAGVGQTAANQLTDYGYRITGSQAGALQHGAAARGAGAIGAEQAMVQGQISANEARQANFNNLLGLGKFGLDIAKFGAGL